FRWSHEKCGARHRLERPASHWPGSITRLYVGRSSGVSGRPESRREMATPERGTGGAPPNVLTKDEQHSRDTVRQLAQSEIAPRVAAMDSAQRIDPALIPQFFELGLMAIEVPERFGGAESSFFTAVLVVEELSRVDPSVGVFVDVQNTLVNNAILRWASEELK